MNAQTTLARQRTKSGNRIVDGTDVTRLARDYGIHASVRIDARELREYDGYSVEQTMTAEESIVAVLSYALQCERDADTLAVILSRLADRRPVEVTFQIHRHRTTGCDRIRLAFVNELEI